MKSRAHMLLEKEYIKLQKEPVWGILAEPLNDGNFFLWEASICGLKDTMWEGGIFKVYLKFSDIYNSVPPQLVFRTIPFHPNVDISTGKPCVDFLDDRDNWNQNFNVGYILLTLQTLLVNPVIKNAVNDHAASIYLDNPKIYRQMVMNCVLESQRLNATLPPHLSQGEADSPAQFTQVQDDVSRKAFRVHASKITFGDYLSLWKGIATSTHSGAPNSLNDAMKNDTKLQGAHFELSKDELAEEIRLQFKEHKRLMYGTLSEKEECGQNNAFNDKKRPSKVELFRHIHSPTSTPSQVLSETPVNDCLDLDKEADDLVNWTKDLSPEQVDS